MFKNYKLVEPYNLGTIDGEGQTQVLGQGDIVITSNFDGLKVKLPVKGVLYAPNARRNILSDGQLSSQGYKISRINDEYIICEGRNVLAKFK